VKQLDCPLARRRGGGPRVGRRYGLGAAPQPTEPRASRQTRVSLLKKIKVSDDWRAHAWFLSYCWRKHFSESRILQPAQPTWM
jgi:hypothetical protein